MRPSWVIAGVVMVGDCERPGDEATFGLYRLCQPEVEHLHGAI